MTREEAIEILEKHHMWTGEPQELIEVRKENETLNMAISALKDIEKIQIIVDTYFTRGSKSGYECMGEIDRILEPYQKGGK